MRAAKMKERPSFQLMVQTDVQSIYHMQMDHWLKPALQKGDIVKHILSLLLTCMLIIECLLFLLWTLAYFDLSPIPQSPFGLQLIAILILILSTVILLFYIRKKNKR